MLSAEIYGTAPTYTPAVPPQTAMSATDSAMVKRGFRGLIDPGSPILWLAGIALVTIGAAGFAGSVRLGPAKLGGKIGKA